MTTRFYMGYKATAQLLGVPVGTLYAWVCRGYVPHIRLSRRCVRFDPDAIDEWLRARTHNPANGSARGAVTTAPNLGK